MDFIKIYYNYDGDAPRESVEKAKNIWLIVYLRSYDEVEQPTHNKFYRVSKEIEYDDVELGDYDKNMPIGLCVWW